MKIVHKKSNGESREQLLKEYFLNAYLIGMLKAVGEQTGKFARRRTELEDFEPVPVKVR